MDESMHKYSISLGTDVGGKNRKEDVMVISVNNLGPRANNEGVVAFLKEVSIVGMALARAVGPCGSW